MLTVLHTESSPGWGGQEKRTLREAQGLRERGARVLFACPAGSGLATHGRGEGFEVREFSFRRSLSPVGILGMMRLIQREKVDVVNTHSGKDGVLAGIAGRVSSRRPLVVRTRHLALPISGRFSYTHLPHRVVTVSEYVRDYLVSVGLDAAQVIAVPTGIDTAAYDPANATASLRQELGITATAPLVGTVAVLRRKKGHRFLLAAVPQVLAVHPDTHFVIAGDGPQEANLHADIARLGLKERVHMLGRRNDVPSLLKAFDIFVLPTLQEALGTAFVEAQAMGKPVVGCRVGGVPEVVRDPETGRLVPPEDVDALAAAINDLLARRAEFSAMAEQARVWVQGHYTLARMCEGMLKVYCDGLAEMGKPV